MRVFVGGSLRENIVHDLAQAHDFAAQLGAEIVKRGHVILNGCKSSFDAETAKGAAQWLAEHDIDPKNRIISYWHRTAPQAHRLGTVRVSALPDWQMSHPELRVPEQIEEADVALFVGGHDGTFLARNWAVWAGKPIIGVPRFGGAGETIYNQELKRRRETDDADVESYEILNQMANGVSEYANDVTSLVERIGFSRRVFAIMSFADDFRNVFLTYAAVCKKFNLEAHRTDESESLDRIIPRIESGIRNCALVIADVSEQSAGVWSPNVLYELGFARGQAKNVILTARQGTRLPFDINDMPVVFWKDQDDLNNGLHKRVAAWYERVTTGR